MEQSILENSKGATYMSFILDIEIVIKKDVKINLAEAKTKSQVSKKDGESKDPPFASMNQDVKVYAVSQPPRKSIFELPWGNDQDSNLSESNKNYNVKMDQSEIKKNKSLSKNISNENKTILNKENIPENINYQEKTDGLGVEKSSVSDEANKERPKKKKISKAEKKAKVFKGKVEPIDFLECNRIFMCNYFKIPISRNKRNCNIKDSSRSSDSKVTVSEKSGSKVINVEQKSLSVEELDKQKFKPLRLHKFWKKNSSSLVNKDSTPHTYSSGDCDGIDTSLVDNNDFRISEVSKIENSLTKTSRRKLLMKRKHLIGDFKFTESKINPLMRRKTEILDIVDNKNLTTEYCHKNTQMDRKSKVLRISNSMPKVKKNMNLQIVNSTKSDINQYQQYKTYKKKSFPFIRALKNRTNSNTCLAKEGLFGLKINCFDDEDFVLAPQPNVENINNFSESNIYILKEENLPTTEKHTHESFKELDEISNETDQINSKRRDKDCSKIYSTSKTSSSVLEDKVSSNMINKSLLKNDESDSRKSVEVIAGNTELSQCINNDVLQENLICKSDTCITTPETNILSGGSDENCISENEYKLGGNSSDNLESELLKTNNLEGKTFKTVKAFSLKNILKKRPVQKCDKDIYKSAIEKQTADKIEKKEKLDDKSKTLKLKTLHIYMRSVTAKLRK